jgi:hypothetical protein
MYICLEGDGIVPERDIIGIFDLDNVSFSYLTREYLAAAEKSGRIENFAYELPRTLIMTQEKDYLSSLVVPKVLARRIAQRAGIDGLEPGTETEIETE